MPLVINISREAKTGQPGFFDLDERYESLSRCGDPLELLAREIPWESFRYPIKKALRKPKKSKAGRKAFDPVMMFKIVVLGSLYNLSDQQMEFQIRDRLSFMRFLGLGLDDRVPDEKTIWLFKDTLAQKKVIGKLFARFDAFLAEKGYTAKKGQIVDASFAQTPRQRNTREENQMVKNDEIPADWTGNPHKLCQKDTDARWTRKGGVTYFGYKGGYLTYQDSFGYREVFPVPGKVDMRAKKDLNSFLNAWLTNLLNQGFARKPACA